GEGGGAGRRRGRGRGERDGDAGAAFGGRVRGGRPAVELDEVLRDGQPEPGPAVAPGRALLDLEEALEDRRPVRLGNPRAAVAHFEHGRGAVRAQRAADRPPRGGEL